MIRGTTVGREEARPLDAGGRVWVMITSIVGAVPFGTVGPVTERAAEATSGWRRTRAMAKSVGEPRRHDIPGPTGLVGSARDDGAPRATGS